MKIKDEDISGILFMLSPAGGYSLREVAEFHGVSPTQIWRISKGARQGARRPGKAAAKPQPTSADLAPSVTE